MSILSFPEVSALWKADKRQYVKKSTYAVYVQLLKNCILPHVGPVPPDEAGIQALADCLLARGYALKSVKDAMLVLKMILRFGEKQAGWPHVECRVRYPSWAQVPQGVVTLSRAQQRKFIAYLREHPHARNAGLLLCLHSGMRIGEVCGLQWQDVDLRCGVLRVRRTVQRIYLADEDVREYSLAVGPPKTPSSVREIPLDRELRALLKAVRQGAAGKCYVLTGTQEPLEPRTYRQYFRRVLARLGLPPVRFHALRHTFATRCIESGCDYKAVSSILGHSSISTTLDLYVHPGHEEKRRCIERMLRSVG